jgi:MFS family permease
MKIAASLTNRNFVLAFCAQLALMSTYQLLMPTLPLYLKGRGCSEIEVGVLIGIMMIAAVVARPVAGRAIARAGSKALMMIGGCLYVAVAAAYLLIPPFWPFLVLRLLHGAAFGIIHTASTTYVVGITDAEHRARMLAYFSLTMNFAGVVAPPLGVELLNRFGSGHLFAAATALSLSTLLITMSLGAEPKSTSTQAAPESRSLLSKGAIPHSTVGFMSLWVWAACTTFFPIYATSLGVANPGVVFTAMAATMILSRVLGGKILDVLERRTLVLACLAISIVSMVLFTVSRDLPLFILSGVVWSLGQAFLMPSLMVLALERAGSSPSPVVATFYAVSDIGVFAGPLVMGVVVHYAGYPFMFFCLSIVGLANLFYFWLLTRNRWRISRPT